MNSFFIIFIVAIIFLCYWYSLRSQQIKLREKEIHLQDKQEAIQQGYTTKIKEAEQRLSSIEEKIQRKEQQFNQKYNFEEQAIQSRLKDYENVKRQSIDQQLEFKKLECQKQKDQYEYQLDSLRQEVQAAAASLQTLKQTRKAAYQSLLRQKEIKSKADDYRLVPSNIELSDIKKLEKVKMELAKPRILSMLIWQTYWQPLAKVKFPIIVIQDVMTSHVKKEGNFEIHDIIWEFFEFLNGFKANQLSLKISTNIS